MFKVLTLDNIAVEGLRRLPRERYEVATEISNPDVILLRGHDMHEMDIPQSVAAIGRAGAGTNNIPVAAMSVRGIPVFNAPGANANAVKELAIAGMLVGARNLCRASAYVAELTETGEALERAVEAGKKQFVGFELPGKTLAVVGLGAIGVEIANTALSLGMKVVGFDAAITVRNAWQLSAGVNHAETMEQLFQHADFVTLHIPLVDATRHLVNAERLALLNDGAVLVNFARGGVVDNDAVINALDSGKLHAFVTDFPTPELIAHPKAVTLPHLGACTAEAEENCAIMVTENVKEYLENGNIRFSVNFPESRLPRLDAWRITLANANVPNMVGQISTCIAKAGVNIEDLLNKSIGELAYTIVDINSEPTQELLAEIAAIEGVLTLRNLGKPV
ncbi:MAG: phosphoglycerate dehydrogenase [Proteobacteria bacterium]|nr:phosphoglycerate dehydrogenase [Pseudomonadota bacterium]